MNIINKLSFILLFLVLYSCGIRNNIDKEIYYSRHDGYFAKMNIVNRNPEILFTGIGNYVVNNEYISICLWTIFVVSRSMPDISIEILNTSNNNWHEHPLYYKIYYKVFNNSNEILNYGLSKGIIANSNINNIYNVYFNNIETKHIIYNNDKILIYIQYILSNDIINISECKTNIYYKVIPKKIFYWDF